MRKYPGLGRKRLAMLALVVASALSVVAAPASAQASAPYVISGGGGGGGGPSCASYEAVGDAGYIAVQVDPNTHYLQWGIYMYNPVLNYGHWVVDAYVGGTRVDHKDQYYPPHGSLPPSIAQSGKIFFVTATLTDGSNIYVSVPNGCTIP